MALADHIPARAGDVVVYNPLSWPRSDVAELPRDLNLPGQHVTDFDGTEKTLVHLKDLPALGLRHAPVGGLPLVGDAHGDSGLQVSTEALENRFFKITLDGNGEIASLYDKRRNREVIDQSSYCKGNALLTFEDKPMNFDAWDIDIYYQDKMTPVQALDSIDVIEQGPLRATVEIKRSFGAGSTITQRISVYRDLPRIDFDTEVDWQERQTLLKAAFPVTVHSARAPPTTSSSATWSGRRTGTPAGTGRASRSAGTSGPTSAKATTASRCSRTASTAGTSRATSCA